MKTYLVFSLLVFGYVCTTFSQKDSLKVVLKEVIVVADKRLKKQSTGYKVLTLNNDVILKNTASFSSLIRFNAPIYIREHGAGGTSSASFRGTSSSNTAVVWNGINVNSVNNGQTGFNSLTVSLFDNISVRSGGGSIEYGSGAVGGTVHLNDELVFKDKQKIRNQIVASVGSFNTLNSLYKFGLSDKNIAAKLGVSLNASENDYPLIGTDLKNENGSYENINISGGVSYKLSPFAKLNLYTTTYLAERFLSGELPNPSSANDKYQDFNNRNLLSFHHKNRNISNEVKLAYLTEEYRFFDDKTTTHFNFGSSERYLVNYKFDYDFSNIKATLSSFTEYESVFGKTDQIPVKNRRQFSQSLVFTKQIKDLLSLDAKVRKDVNSDFRVPFTYALGIKTKSIKHFSLRANGSKNFRVPTYNDLFWPGQGNINLKPETALQGEVGVVYLNKNLKVDIAGFYISAKDKIVWTPNGDLNRPGIWTPVNLSNTVNKGLEALLQYNYAVGEHTINVTSNYSYTNAKDAETNTFLIFVPKHLINTNFGYSFKRVHFFYQYLYTGQTYTLESNSKDAVVPSFNLSNLGFEYKLLTKKQQKITIGFKVNNLLNTLYFTQPRRPLPSRNLNFNINYKF